MHVCMNSHQRLGALRADTDPGMWVGMHNCYVDIVTNVKWINFTKFLAVWSFRMYVFLLCMCMQGELRDLKITCRSLSEDILKDGSGSV
jgi:hypothetical protein